MDQLVRTQRRSMFGRLSCSTLHLKSLLEMQSNVCIHTVVHECIFTILTRAELRAVEQCFSSVQALNLEKLARHCYIRQPTPIPFPTDGDGFRFIKHPKTNKTKSKACYSRDPYQSLGFSPTPLCMDMQGCTFAIPLCCWKSKSWKQVFWHVMVFQCLVTIKLTDSCLAGCPKPTFR